MINAVRTLTQGSEVELLLGHTTGYYLLRVLLWTVGIVAISILIAAVLFQRR